MQADRQEWEFEWKIARETIDRFDKTLVDLRKFGFSFITALLTAQAFLGAGANSSGLQQTALSTALTASMGLVVILYCMDRLYEILLYGSVFRATILEEKLDFGLTMNISELYGKIRLVKYVPPVIYFGLILVAELIYYWMTGGWIIYPFVSALAIFFVWAFLTEPRLRKVQKRIEKAQGRSQAKRGNEERLDTL